MYSVELQHPNWKPLNPLTLMFFQGIQMKLVEWEPCSLWYVQFIIVLIGIA